MRLKPENMPPSLPLAFKIGRLFALSIEQIFDDTGAGNE
jgi:DNA-binding XRE family transcriptional regulator